MNTLQQPSKPAAGPTVGSSSASALEEILTRHRSALATSSIRSTAGDEKGVTYITDQPAGAPAGPKTRSKWLTSPADQDINTASFDRLVELKMATSQIAMHLQAAWRAGLFRQLDKLLAPEDWDPCEALPDLAAYRTFLRMTIFLGRIRRPSLGATADGHILAAWFAESGERLTVDCGPDDQIRWVLTLQRDGERESAAGRTLVRRLPEVLAPYGPDRWFKIADNVHSG